MGTLILCNAPLSRRTNFVSHVRKTVLKSKDLGTMCSVRAESVVLSSVVICRGHSCKVRSKLSLLQKDVLSRLKMNIQKTRKSPTELSCICRKTGSCIFRKGTLKVNLTLSPMLCQFTADFHSKQDD